MTADLPHAAATAAAADDHARRRPLVGAAMLLVAAVVWGFAFIPQKLTVVGLGPLQATAIRFVLAAPLPLLLANRRLKKPGVTFASAALLGVILIVIYALQTAALVYAPVARVSLITGMYAVFTPLFAPLLGHARPTALHWGGAALAFVGLLALTGVVGAGDDVLAVPLNRGDALVLAHAVISAFQVLLVGKLARTADPLALNAIQLVVVGLIAVPLALAFEGMPDLAQIAPKTWASFAYLAVFSTVGAFTFQILGQKNVSPPTAAVIMLLETPIGVVGALYFFDEQMGLVQWLGAAVVLAGVAASLYAEVRRATPPTKT